jgi:phospholipase C
MPVQENGTRPARALPYKIYTDCRADNADNKFWIDLINEGKAGAAFYIYSTKQPQENPRRYTVSASQRLSDYWNLSDLGSSKLSVFGPNGYLSEFSNDPSSDHAGKLEIKLRHQPRGDIHLTLHNSSSTSCTLKVTSSYDAKEVRHHTIAPGKVIEDRWALASSSGWFHISITQDSAPCFLRRFAGHVGNGKPSISDPAVFKEA